MNVKNNQVGLSAIETTLVILAVLISWTLLSPRGAERVSCYFDKDKLVEVDLHRNRPVGYNAQLCGLKVADLPPSCLKRYSEKRS